MTIGEAAEAAGLSRDNIRFYEKEGLLTPARGANGYRDYTGNDVRELRRIRLLRQLRFPVAEIRALRTGDLPLYDALNVQAERLAREIGETAQARDTCLTLLSSGATYETLDTLPCPLHAALTVEADVPPPLGHPWRRYFARLLDMGLYALLWTAVQQLALHWNPPTGLFWTLLDSYIGYGLLLVCEPLLLHFCGATPGKWLMGLDVRDSAGNRPTLEDAFTRTFGVFRWGYGWGIPFWSLFRLIRSYLDSTKGELPWDDGDLFETLRDERVWRPAVTVTAYTVLLAAMITIVLQAALLPRYRGEVTPEQLAANINRFLSYHALTERRVAPDGSWVEPPETPGAYVIYADEGLTAEPQFSFVAGADGAVETLQLTADFEAPADGAAMPIWPHADYQLAALSSFGFAQPDVHLWTLLAFRRDSSGFGSYFENWETEFHGLRVCNEVSYEGYENAGDMLFPIDGKNKRFSAVFTMELLT